MSFYEQFTTYDECAPPGVLLPQIKIEVDGQVKETMVGIQPIEVLLGKIHIYTGVPNENANESEG